MYNNRPLYLPFLSQNYLWPLRACCCYFVCEIFPFPCAFSPVSPSPLPFFSSSFPLRKLCLHFDFGQVLPFSLLSKSLKIRPFGVLPPPSLFLSVARLQFLSLCSPSSLVCPHCSWAVLRNWPPLVYMHSFGSSDTQNIFPGRLLFYPHLQLHTSFSPLPLSLLRCFFFWEIRPIPPLSTTFVMVVEPFREPR